MNEPVMVIQATLNTGLQLSSCVCLNGLPTKYLLYLLKLISIFGHFLIVNNCRYGRCHIKNIIPLYTFPEFYTQLEANSERSFQNAFCKCSRALTIMFLKTSYFWWIVSFFSLILNLCHLITPVNPQWKSKSKSQTGWYVSSLLADKLIVFFLNFHVY